MSCAAGRGAEGSVKGGRSVPVHRSAAETLDGFRPALPYSRMKRGHWNEEEIRFSSAWFLRVGVRGRNQAVTKLEFNEYWTFEWDDLSSGNVPHST